MRAAFLGFDGCAIWQVALLQMFLCNAGWAIETMSSDGNEILTDGGLTLQPNRSLEDAVGADYDLILMAGGDVPDALLGSESLRRFLADCRGLIAASCASAVLVGAAGLITGNYTCMNDTAKQYQDCFKDGTYVDTDVCISNRIVTSKGHAHYDFMMAVLEAVGLTVADAKLPRIALKLSKNQPA